MLAKWSRQERNRCLILIPQAGSPPKGSCPAGLSPFYNVLLSEKHKIASGRERKCSAFSLLPLLLSISFVSAAFPVPSSFRMLSWFLYSPPLLVQFCSLIVLLRVSVFWCLFVLKLCASLISVSLRLSSSSKRSFPWQTLHSLELILGLLCHPSSPWRMHRCMIKGESI